MSMPTAGLPAKPQAGGSRGLPLRPTASLPPRPGPTHPLPSKPDPATTDKVGETQQIPHGDGGSIIFKEDGSASAGTQSTNAKRKADQLKPDEQAVEPSPSVEEQATSLSSAPQPARKDPIPILPTPLPSKRFRKNPLKRATLFPIEQVPTFPLPPLPAIDDPVLLKQVFTHLSLFKLVKGKFEDPEDDQPKHYEKLEHVGDSLLGMIVTTWLHEVKPGLTPGTATQLKAHLVSNATLSHLSGLYNLPQRLNADSNLLPLLRASTDVRAALMEAYIAGVYVSFPPQDRYTRALPILNDWLREMYDPLLDFFYTYMKRERTQHSNAVGADDEGNVIVMDEETLTRIDDSARGMWLLVKMHCDACERMLKWEEERYETSIGTLFKIAVIVDGMELGTATRAGKQQAKDGAAWEAAKKLGIASA